MSRSLGDRVDGVVSPAVAQAGAGRGGRQAAGQRRGPRAPDTPVSSGIAELPPPDASVEAPPYGYVQRILRGREREMGASASGSRAVRDSGTRQANVSSRSFTDIVREIRRRRKLLVTPPIPPGYRKTTQVVRAGQALFADLTHRLPAVLTAKPMTVAADPVDDDEDAQEAATLKEEWTTAVLLGQEGRRSVLDAGQTSVWRDCMDNLVNTGRACWTLSERLDRWSLWSTRFPDADDYEDDEPESPTPTADAAEGYLRSATGETPRGRPRRRRSASEKYLRAVEAFKRSTPPFALEAIDPLSMHIVQDGEGVEDEAVVVVNRPYRETLAAYGLTPTAREKGTPGTVAGTREVYAAGPLGFGRAYPLTDAEPERPYEPEHLETVTYYCSARRAVWLGLVDPQGPAFDPDCGVWAHYVDGVCVASGPLWGPSWHPLPVFRAYGLTTAMGDPTYTGIAAPMHLVELIDLLDQIITMELHVSFWSSWPPLVEEDRQGGAPGAAGLSGDTVTDPERTQRPDQNRSTDGKIIEPGRFYSVPPGRTWRYLVLPPESTAHLERLYTKATALIDLIGIPSVLRGQGGGGQAGYAIAQLMIAARSLYGPVVENYCAQVATCIQYLWWQVWRRFPEGVPVFFLGDAGAGKKRGWRTLRPQDLAPDGRGAGRGTPFLACSVEADPLLPVDEAQLEMRGIQAQQSGAVDMLTMRERYFNDPAPERTEARVLADKINTHPLIQESMALRGAVRQGALTPEMALSWLESKFGVSAQMAFDQLLQIGAFDDEQAARLLVQLEQAKLEGQAQGLPGMPGPLQIPGAPGGPPGVPGMPAPVPGGLPPGPVPGMPGMPPGVVPGMPMPGAPGNALPMQLGGAIPGTPAPPPGVPALPGLPPVATMPPPAPPMGPPLGGGGFPQYPGAAFQQGLGGGGWADQVGAAYGATGMGGGNPSAPGGAAVSGLRGILNSRGGMRVPGAEAPPWQKQARDLTR
jgi:hypothetical protein